MKKTMKDLVVEQMVDEVCRRYGFEAKVTISFCFLCERTNNFNLIKKKYNKIINNNNNNKYITQK